jgi:predicted DCC family thiol-disulfide oxidoreductase YuxK
VTTTPLDPAAAEKAQAPQEAAPRDWVLYYDGDCGFCTTIVQLLARFDFARRVAWIPYQSLSQPPAGLTWVDLDKAAYIEGGGRLEGGFFAFRRLTLLLPPLLVLAPLMWLPGLRLLGQPAYRLIARNRYRLSRQGCETPRPRSD